MSLKTKYRDLAQQQADEMQCNTILVWDGYYDEWRVFREDIWEAKTGRATEGYHEPTVISPTTPEQIACQ